MLSVFVDRYLQSCSVSDVPLMRDEMGDNYAEVGIPPIRMFGMDKGGFDGYEG